MATLEEKFEAYADAQNGGAPAGLFRPVVRDFFMAGAAAMAELFAAGSALKVEQAPRRYRVRGNSLGIRFFEDQRAPQPINEVVLAFDANEAVKRIKIRLAIAGSEFGLHSVEPAE